MSLNNLRNLRKYVNEDLSLLLFKQIILPVFDYGDLSLDSGPEGLID